MKKSKALLAIGRSFEASLYEAAGFLLAPRPTTQSIALTDVFTAIVTERFRKNPPEPVFGGDGVFRVPIMVEIVYIDGDPEKGVDFDKTFELTNRKVDYAARSLRLNVMQHGGKRPGHYRVEPCENVMIANEVKVVGMLTWRQDA